MIQVLCIVGMGLLGIIGLLILTGGNDALQEFWSPLVEDVSGTWHDIVTFNFDSILQRWFDGFLGLAFLAVMGAPVLLLILLNSNE